MISSVCQENEKFKKIDSFNASVKINCNKLSDSYR